MTSGNGNGNGNGRTKKTSRRRWIFAAAAIALVAVFGLMAMRNGTEIDPSRLATIERGDVARSVVATGKIQPLTQVEIKSKASGIVENLLVHYGDTVETGQILAELDGFTGHQAVVILAATNRPDVLDPALLRPGRFDRHVTLDLPDRKARAAILRVHTRDVPLAEDADLDVIAATTTGFSGADLKNLVNEAAMLAAREDAPAITIRHFEEMRDRVVIGSERSIAMTDEEHHRLAVHEAGHTTVAYYLPRTDPLFKVTAVQNVLR